jgi:N-acyl-D-amino-acid deacylase
MRLPLILSLVLVGSSAASTHEPTARRLSLADRGIVAAGKKADLVVVDPSTIVDLGTPADPAQSPVGIDLVIVNGKVVLDHGTMTSARPGRALRRSP